MIGWLQSGGKSRSVGDYFEESEGGKQKRGRFVSISLIRREVTFISD